jgi:hypothetical protein
MRFLEKECRRRQSFEIFAVGVRQKVGSFELGNLNAAKIATRRRRDAATLLCPLPVFIDTVNAVKITQPPPSTVRSGEGRVRDAPSDMR